MTLKVYGCRGSAAISHLGGSEYGGNTSCLTIESGSSMLILDAGSGLLALDKELFQSPNSFSQLHLLLSHLHMDHICGLPLFTPTLAPTPKLHIYTCPRGDGGLAKQVLGVFRPPYWPVAVADVSPALFHKIYPGTSFAVAPFTITPFTNNHPDNTLGFCISNRTGKTAIYLLDSEIGALSRKEYTALVELCNNADIIVFDAAYSGLDYHAHKGWGHSCVADGLRLAEDSKCKKMLFSHFSQKYSDSQISSWIAGLDNEKFILAHDGLSLSI